MRSLFKNSFANTLSGIFFRKIFTKNVKNKKNRKLFYSRRFKIKTISLIFGLVGLIIATYVSYIAIKEKHISNSNISVGKYDILKNEFEKFFYKTHDASGKEIIISAEKVIEESKDDFIFEKVKSSFALANEDSGIITSKNGKVTLGNKTICEFKDNVVMTTKSGILLRTEEAVFDSDKKNIFGNSQVNIETNGTKLSANTYDFNTSDNILMLNKSAKALNKNYKISSDKLIIELNREYKNSIKMLTAKSNASLLSEGYDLSAQESIVYQSNSDKKSGMINADKNVKFIYKTDNNKNNNSSYNYNIGNKKNFTVQSDKMRATLNSEFKVSEIIADGAVKIKTKDSLVKANHGIYKGNKVIVTGNVIISKKQGDVFGEIAELDLDTEEISVKKSSGVLINSKG